MRIAHVSHYTPSNRNRNVFNSNNLSAPTISYHYPRTIRSRVLNYKEAYDDYSDPNTMSCDCSSSTFMDNHFKHVITGDLSLIKDDKLRTLYLKDLIIGIKHPLLLI